jgi:hypothetical protein
MKPMKKNAFLVFMLAMFISINSNAQHCGEAAIADNGASAKLKDGSGFSGSYALPCIQQGAYTELTVPFKLFTTIPHGNGDDTVYQMRIDQISNLPEGMCWLSTKADNIYKMNEGGNLMLRGITKDNTGQFSLSITMSFDTNGDGTFDRTNVNYNKISKTGKMILRVVNSGMSCEMVDYSLSGNIAGSGVTTASGQ